MIEKSDEEKALNYALRLLSIKPRSAGELKEKLIKKGFTESSSDKVLNKVEKLGYINDEEFARLWVEERVRLKNYGKIRIKNELVAKKIDRETIEKALSSYDEEAEEERARTAAEKKLGTLKEKNYLTKKRQLSQFLFGRGFEYGTVSKICRELIKD